jgi:hypothetical protein
MDASEEVTEGENVDEEDEDEENEDKEASGSGSDNEQSKAAKLYRNTMDELFANPDQKDVDELLKNSDDDSNDEDYAGIDTDKIIGHRSTRGSGSATRLRASRFSSYD